MNNALFDMLVYRLYDNKYWLPHSPYSNVVNCDIVLYRSTGTVFSMGSSLIHLKYYNQRCRVAIATNIPFHPMSASKPA